MFVFRKKKNDGLILEPSLDAIFSGLNPKKEAINFREQKRRDVQLLMFSPLRKLATKKGDAAQLKRQIDSQL